MTDLQLHAGRGALIPSADEYERIRSIGKAFAASGMFGGVKDEAVAVTKILIGLEFGLAPAVSMRGIYMWSQNGTPQTELAYWLKGALINQSGVYRWRFLEHDETVCEAAVYYQDEEIGTVRYTLQDADRAGLAGKDVWKKYPEDMLAARVISRIAKRFCPELFGGFAGSSRDDEQEHAAEQVVAAENLADQPRALEPGPSPDRVRKRIFAIAREIGLGDDARHEMLRDLYGKDSLSALTAVELDEFADELAARKRDMDTRTLMEEFNETTGLTEPAVGETGSKSASNEEPTSGEQDKAPVADRVGTADATSAEPESPTPPTAEALQAARDEIAVREIGQQAVEGICLRRFAKRREPGGGDILDLLTADELRQLMQIVGKTLPKNKSRTAQQETLA